MNPDSTSRVNDDEYLKYAGQADMIQVKIFLFYMFVDFIGKCVLPIILGCLYVFVGTYGKQKSTLKTRPNITECEKRIRFACDLCSFFCGIQISLYSIATTSPNVLHRYVRINTIRYSEMR